MEIDAFSFPIPVRDEQPEADAPASTGTSGVQFDDMLSFEERSSTDDEHQSRSHEHKPWSTLNVARELRLDGSPDDPTVRVLEKGIRENLQGQLSQLERVAHQLPHDELTQAVDDLGEEIFDATRNGVVKEHDAKHLMQKLQQTRPEEHTRLDANNNDLAIDADALLSSVRRFLHNHDSRYGNG